jgi:hypothetical protein
MKIYKNNGTALVTFLIFSLIALGVATSLVATIVSSSYGANRIQQSGNILKAAESGVENAIIRILRDPDYTGETMQINEVTVQIQISGTNPIDIYSTAVLGSISRKIHASISINDLEYQVISYQEEF